MKSKSARKLKFFDVKLIKLSTMRFSMDSRCLDIFTKNLRFMARNSNELFIEATDNLLRLRVCNDLQTNVAIASYDDIFFLSYEKSANNEENFMRVSFNVLLNCLRNTKDVSVSSFSYDVGKDRLKLFLKKLNGIEVTHKISLLENEELSEVVNDADMNEITCHPSVFNRLQCKFAGDMKVEFKKDSVLLENFIENDEEDQRSARLHFLLHSSEFLRYEVRQQVMLVFSWLEFINVIDLAAQLNCSVGIQFSKPGKPIQVTIETGSHYSIKVIQLSMNDVTVGRKRNQSAKVVAYKEPSSSEVAHATSSIIHQSENRGNAIVVPQIVGISEIDMDDMIAATTSGQQKRPRLEVDASVQLTQQEQNEMDLLLDDLANFEDMVVDHDDILRSQHEEIIERASGDKEMKMGRFKPKPSSCLNKDMVEILRGSDTEDY